MSISVFASADVAKLSARFHQVRTHTTELCRSLSPEDMMVQSSAEASPAKWHLAHTAWFFESFILREFLADYRMFHPDFVWLFNSYYQSFSAFPEKRLRASFSRPALTEIVRYRTHVDEAVQRLLENIPPEEALRRIELGLNHEEQHQELLLTDILHAFFTNPLKPVYSVEPLIVKTGTSIASIEFLPFAGGIVEAGYADKDFCYHHELPRHSKWLEPYKLPYRALT